MNVSVLVPTYNRPDALVKAVKSVLGQSRQPEEVVVVDDASDRSYEEARSKLRSLSEGTDTVVRYHRMDTNGGACRARNEAARRAEGSILMFLDDDDVWEPHKIDGQISRFDDQPNLGLVYSGRKVIDQQGNMLYKVYPQAEGNLQREILQRNLIGTTSSVAVRSVVFEKVGGFDESMPALQDYDLWIRVACEAPIGYDPKCTVHWRIHSESDDQMGGNPEIYQQAFSNIQEKYKGKFKRLDFLEKRRFESYKYTSLATKYGRVSYKMKLLYTLRSLMSYPTISGTSKILPTPIWYLARRVYNRVV